MIHGAKHSDRATINGSAKQVHALTVDVEDFDCLVLRHYLGLSIEPQETVVRGTNLLLEVFSRFSVRATFFFLGEVAKAFPALVRQVFEAGHEIAVHGYSHRKFFDMTPKQAFSEVYTAKRVLEDIIGEKVIGHRAPAFSIRPDTAWAFEVLCLAGFSYDSSVMPFAGTRYGWPNFPLHIHRIELDNGMSLIEAPMPTICIAGKRWPFGGGGYLRHFPYSYTAWALKRIGNQRPIIAYIHPYDVDTLSTFKGMQSKLCLSKYSHKINLRLQFRNRHKVVEKICKLLSDACFTTLSAVIDHTLISGHGRSKAESDDEKDRCDLSQKG